MLAADGCSHLLSRDLKDVLNEKNEKKKSNQINIFIPTQDMGIQQTIPLSSIYNTIVLMHKKNSSFNDNPIVLMQQTYQDNEMRLKRPSSNIATISLRQSHCDNLIATISL